MFRTSQLRRWRSVEGGGIFVMVHDKVIARQLSEMFLDIGARIDRSVELVQENCTEEELSEYRRAAGMVMGEVLLSVLNRLYEVHPSLRPTGLDEPS